MCDHVCIFWAMLGSGAACLKDVLSRSLKRYQDVDDSLAHINGYHGMGCCQAWTYMSKWQSSRCLTLWVLPFAKAATAPQPTKRPAMS